MKNPWILAACLTLTPFLASATNDAVAPNTPVSKGAAANTTGADPAGPDTRALTPLHQKNNESDVKVTQEIRQALMKGSFSVDAKNIRVITRDGQVSLLGTVKTKAELEKVLALVKPVPGVKTVDNQLQVN